MKNTSPIKPLIFIFLGIIILSCQSKKSNMPELAVAEFNKIYPNAKSQTWTDHDSIWEVTYTLDGLSNTSEFRINGMWVQTSRVLKSDMLPQAVVDKMNGFYTGYVIKRSILIENPDLKAYDIGIEINTQNIDLFITESGEMRKAEIARPANTNN